MNAKKRSYQHFQMWFGAGFISHDRTASLLISLREAARKVPNFAQPIILAYGTYASVNFFANSAGAWLYGVLRKKRINGAKAHFLKSKQESMSSQGNSVNLP